jgi:S1-C subfamily serine protease
MKRRALILTAIIMSVTGAMWTQTRAADEPAKWDDGQKLGELSKASQSLYKKISASLVRVKIESSVGGGAPAHLIKEFEEWRQKQGAGPGRRERAERAERGERPDRRAEPSPAVTSMPARPVGAGPAAFRKFLEQKLKDAPDAESQARIRAVLARMENAGGRGGGGLGAVQSIETTGVVIDDQGHTLVAWGFGASAARENAAIRVTTSDGTEVGAKYVGAHIGRGMAVIKLDSPGIAIPLTLADGRPAGGEMLMCMNARQGSLGWIAAPGQNPARAHPVSHRATDERFPVFGSDERGGTYLFNTSGELAAVGMERYAVPIEVFKDDIKWIIKNGRDISPRRLGVKYDPVSPDMRKSLPALADKPAVLVKEVAPNSPADKAGLKKGDILVTIDDVSVALFPQIQVDLASRHGTVVMGIIRGGQEKTLDMPLGEK